MFQSVWFGFPVWHVQKKTDERGSLTAVLLKLWWVHVSFSLFVCLNNPHKQETYKLPTAGINSTLVLWQFRCWVIPDQTYWEPKTRLKLCVLVSWTFFHICIWHVVVFLKNVSPEMLPGKLVSAIFSEIQHINNRDQLAICALINGVPQEGCVPLVLNTAGSSLPVPLALWLSFYCWTRRWDQDVERLRAFFSPPLH